MFQKRLKEKKILFTVFFIFKFMQAKNADTFCCAKTSFNLSRE
jgi:hypothetical protein